MKLYQVIDPGFQKALEELGQAPMPVSVGYRLTDLLERVSTETKKVRAIHQKLLAKHAQKNKNGSLKTNKERTEYLMEDRPAFDKDYGELINIEIELPKIKIDDIKDLKISPIAVSKLKPLIIP